jgi:RNA polymerase sigma-70 factor (ECF subfamily)
MNMPLGGNQDSDETRLPARAQSPFVTTQWTRVLATRGDSEDAKAALTELCETYYAPVVTFLRCSGNDSDRARELAHAFFARILESGGFNRLERGRTRFRSYLLGAVKHFAADQRQRERALKRGAGAEHVPIESGSDTSPGVDPLDPNCRGPEREFDRQWALTILERALARLAADHQDAESRIHFELLKPWLTGENTGLSQAGAASQLSMNEGAVKAAIHRLRKRFREFVNAEVARTVCDPAQVKEEMQSLIAALQ